MRIIVLFALLAFGMNVEAQITLEHTYDSASTYGYNNFQQAQLFHVNLEVSGERYINVNMTGKYVSIYNMNHELLKKISFANFPLPPNGIPTLLYFSEHLFNTDDLLEFMYIYSGSTNLTHTRIYQENGTCIFNGDSLAPIVLVSVPQSQFPVFNTSSGTKMILSMQFTGKAKLYSLPGTLTTDIEQANSNLINKTNLIANAYPNPTGNTTQIEYQLPDGIHEGEIVFFNLQGKEVRRYKVDRTFSTLLIQSSDLPAGTYFYRLQTAGQYSEGKKLIVTK